MHTDASNRELSMSCMDMECDRLFCTIIFSILTFKAYTSTRITFILEDREIPFIII